jgi:transposase-like protein
MVGTCYKCKDYTEVSKKNTQRNGSLLCICKSCRNDYQKFWKERRQRLLAIDKYEKLARTDNSEGWTKIAKDNISKLSLRAH